jgi:dihydropyrimidinase
MRGMIVVRKYDLVIKSGIIVTASDHYKADIGITQGKIVEIGYDLQGENVYDAQGNYIIPGGIDAHTHLDMPFGGTFSSDDFNTGTKAAAIGGTTTVIDFAVQPQGKTLHDTVKMWREKGDGKANIDFGLHLAVTQMNDTTRKELPEVIAEGYSSFKVFMVYDGMRVTDDVFMEILSIVSDNGGLIGVHAENYDSINYMVKKLLSEGKTQPKYHAQSRPQACEAEATNRAVKLAQIVGAPLYVVHVSNDDSAEEIKKARSQGYPIMGETCPQYLLLSEDNYEEEGFNGAKYVMSPPLRNKKNQPLLWNHLRENTLQTIATDHCPFFMKQKEMGKDNFTKIPNGAPGIELRIPIMYSFGVADNRITLEKFVELTSTNVAKIFGLYPQKGSIIAGADADLVIFDSHKECTVSVDMLHENVDYTPYEGFKLQGYPIATFSRGDLIAENGKYVGKEGRGKFIKRGAPQII